MTVKVKRDSEVQNIYIYQRTKCVVMGFTIKEKHSYFVYNHLYKSTADLLTS